MPIYMNYSGIPGESQSGTSHHKQWLEISSFQWGVGRGISNLTSSPSDREGSTSVGEIVVTKKTDADSPNLFQHCLVGTRLLVSILLTNTKKPGGPRHKIDLKNAVITAVQPSSTSSGRGEKLTLRFSEYHFNGALNVPIPPRLIPPEGSQTLPVNEGSPVRPQEIWTPVHFTPAQVH